MSSASHGHTIGVDPEERAAPTVRGNALLLGPAKTNAFIGANLSGSSAQASRPRKTVPSSRKRFRRNAKVGNVQTDKCFSTLSPPLARRTYALSGGGGGGDFLSILLRAQRGRRKKRLALRRPGALPSHTPARGSPATRLRFRHGDRYISPSRFRPETQFRL